MKEDVGIVITNNYNMAVNLLSPGHHSCRKYQYCK